MTPAIVTERGPDTVRGADIVFYSFALMPKDSIPDDYPEVPPELFVEVRSPSDRWRDIQEKVDEYLKAGVLVVCVLDSDTTGAHLFRAGVTPQILGPDDELTFPECLPGFSVPVRRFFE